MSETLHSKNRIRKTDVAAFAVFFCIVGLSLLAVYYQLSIEDEPFHTAIAQKLAFGDRMFVDDWGVTQMPHLFGVIPYKLFTAIRGSTEGILVFMRYVYLAADFALYWFFYLKLRHRGWGSVLTAALLSGSPIFGQMHLNYYNIALQGSLIVAFLLFLPTEKNSRFRLAFVGTVYSCVVICEPGFALLYALYTLLVLLRSRAQKNRRSSRLDSYSFVLDAKIWRGISAAIAVCFIAFITWLLCSSGLRNVIENMPYVLQDSMHMDAKILYGFAIERKWFALRETYSVILVVLMVALSAAALVCRKKRIKRNEKLYVFFASLLVCTAAYTTAIIRCCANDETLLYFQQCVFLPVHILALTLLLLNENNDRRLTAFWIFGTAASVATDFLSMGMIAFGGKLSCVPAVFLVGTITKKILHDESVPKKTKKPSVQRRPVWVRGTAIALSAIVAASGVSATGFQYAVGYYQQRKIISETKESLEPITSGPMKGIVAYDTYRRFYRDVDSDLDQIKANCKGSVYTTFIFPYAYLYLCLPIGAYSVYCPPITEQARHRLYWKMHPEKRPEYIYILTRTDDPAYLEILSEITDADFPSFLDDICDYELTHGSAGDILHVTRWKL